MADILPYLGVEQTFSEDDVAGKKVVMEDLTDMSATDAQKKLKDSYLTAKFIGTGDTVTGQIPAAGQSVAGGSEVLLYLGEPVDNELVQMPDFTGMNRQQASDAAGRLGIYILVKGNNEISTAVTVTAQSIPAGTQVSVGTTVELEFTDTKAAD